MKKTDWPYAENRAKNGLKNRFVRCLRLAKRKYTGKGGGVYAATRELGDSIADQLVAMFPEGVPNQLVQQAVAELAEQCRAGMGRALKKHILTGETYRALDVEEYEIPTTADAKSAYIVGIPRDGNVRDEHYKGSRRRRRYPSTQKVSGELGDGPFYKGIYLEYGHGSLKPQKWVEAGVKYAKRKVTPVFLETLRDVWNESHKKS